MKCEKFIFSLDKVMRMERMRGEALDRKNGLDVEWGERGIEKKPLTAEGINTELPLPPAGGSSSGAKGTSRETQERGTPPLF